MGKSAVFVLLNTCSRFHNEHESWLRTAGYHYERGVLCRTSQHLRKGPDLSTSQEGPERLYFNSSVSEAVLIVIL